MSIFFDFEIGPSGRRFRRAVDQDRKDIEQIMKNGSGKLFSEVNIGRLIELCALSICMIDERRQVMGFLALDDRPDEPAIDPASWEEWIGIMFQKLFHSRGTLFIHCICCVDSVQDYFLKEALISVFLNDAYLRQIVLVIPPGKNSDSFTGVHSVLKHRPLLKYFVRGDDALSNYCLQVAFRQDFCPRLKIRRAVEEDNDDIVEILDKICPRLKELYGKYYASEIVGQRPANSRQIIVAQLQDHVVGVMCLNSEINYSMLQNTYELNVYHGLIKVTPDELKQYHRNNNLMNNFGKPLLSGKWSPFDRVDKLEVKPTVEDIVVSEIHNGQLQTTAHTSTQKIDDGLLKRERASKVNFRPTEQRLDISEPLHDSEDYSEKHMVVDFGPNAYLTVISTLEDEPLEYEIVNIDRNLITSRDDSSILSFSKPIFRNTSRRWTKTRRSSLKTKIQEPTPYYEGPPNAFIIEIFGLSKDIDERLGYDLLRAAFECMQTQDYCVIRVPTCSKSFALLQHFCVVPPKSNICTEHAMYVTHRNSILGKFKVRRAEYADIPQISVLLQALDVKETIWTIKRTLEQEDAQQCYVFLSGLSIIGLAILEPPEEIDFLHKKFTIDHHECHQYHSRGHGISCGYSTINTTLIYPIFEMHYRFFMRELMRLANSSSIIWLTPYRNKWLANKANSLAVSMVPLLPRKTSMGEFDMPDFKISFTSSTKKNNMSFCTWYMNKKLTSVPKLNVDCRIVVVGASRTAMGFLNTLLFQDSCTYLTFTSVTLVSPHGLPYLRHSNPSAELMFPKYRTYCAKFLKCTPYTYYVNIVQGIMVEVDKKEKYIALDNGNRYYYDLLFLCFGNQYQHPNYMKTLLERDEQFSKGHIPYTPMDKSKSVEMDPPVDYDIPENVFIINSIVEAATGLNFVKSLMWEDNYSYQIVVYGATIEAYCCVSALLNFGVPPENIIFIEAFPPEDPKKPRVPVFCNTHVDKTVRNSMQNLKLKVYTAAYFVSWAFQYDENLITHVEFLSYNKIIKLQCSAFFYYGKKGINPHAFIAMNKAGIAYDGGILIDHELRTKDPYIYAAGPCTRYYRRYLAEYKRHKYYDSHEVGKILGTQIRNQLDPYLIDQSSQKKYQSTGKFSFDRRPSAKSFLSGSFVNQRSSQESMQEDWAIPIPKRPIKIHCILPGNLRYLEVRSPGVKVPHYYIQSLQYNGIVMETFKHGYFKIHMTKDMIVDGLTCLTQEKYCLENFKNFYGLSSIVLSKVYLRYTSHRIDDFFTFFRGPWAAFLYQDRLEELLATVKELVPKADGELKPMHEGQTLEEALRALADTIDVCSYNTEKDQNGHCRNYTKEKIKSTFEKSAHFGAIADYIIEWLSENEMFFPMYMQPAHISKFTCDFERHTCLKKKKLNIAKSLLNESQNSLCTS